MTASVDLSPQWIPDGYKLFRRVEGALFEGFPGDEQQAILMFGRGWRDVDAYRPLLIYLAGEISEPILFGTEEQAGSLLRLADGTESVYHDGRWELGRGEGEAQTPSGGFVHWDTSEWHSITAVVQGRVFAVRGSRLNAVGLEELRRVADSLLNSSAVPFNG
jgi:hypothetical protein